MVDIAYLKDLMHTLGVLFTVIFVVSSMLALGFSVTASQIIGPLRNVKVVGLALLVNFVLIPLLSMLLIVLFPLTEGLALGLFATSLSAGSPLLPRLVETAKGDVGKAVGIMVLLMVITVAYLPIILPLISTDVAIDYVSIARPLFLYMLIPLTIALIFRTRYERIALAAKPYLTKTSNLSFIVLMVAFFIAFAEVFAGIIGSTAIIVTVIFIIGSFTIGYFLGGSDHKARKVLGISASQRNLSAAAAVAIVSFSDDPEVMIMVLVIGLAGTILIMLIAQRLGMRT